MINNFPKLTRARKCKSCDQWIESPDGCIPDHEDKLNKKCVGTDCVTQHGYIIKTKKEAFDTARFIRDDDEECLDHFIAPGRHSPNCGDGRECHAKRLRLAKALAVYCLSR